MVARRLLRARRFQPAFDRTVQLGRQLDRAVQAGYGDEDMQAVYWLSAPSGQQPT